MQHTDIDVKCEICTFLVSQGGTVAISDLCFEEKRIVESMHSFEEFVNNIKINCCFGLKYTRILMNT